MGSTSVLVLGFLLLGTSFGQGQPGTFSLPNSKLMFSNYADGLILVTPQSSEKVHAPSTVGRGPVAIASLGKSGKLVAWGFPVSVDPPNKIDCVVAVYSVLDRKWAVHGRFSSVSKTELSPDESKVMFIATQGTDNEAQQSTLILDVHSGKIDEMSQQASESLSWSPDGKRLATGSGVMDLRNSTLQNFLILGERHFPSWSPSGEWIAYIDASKQKIHIVHPDGSADHVIKNVKNHLLGYRFFALKPIWSPDSTSVLLNEYKADGDALDVVMMDIRTGKATIKLVNSRPILGWAVWQESGR